MTSSIPSSDPLYAFSLLSIQKRCELLRHEGCQKYRLKTPQSYSHAHKFWVMAARIGDVACIYNLGVMYENGKGVKKSAKIAATYYSLAAQKEDKMARRQLNYLIDLYELEKIE
jgi:TPR repeat protein